jgi:hypothetical protein
MRRKKNKAPNRVTSTIPKIKRMHAFSEQRMHQRLSLCCSTTTFRRTELESIEKARRQYVKKVVLRQQRYLVRLEKDSAAHRRSYLRF